MSTTHREEEKPKPKRSLKVLFGYRSSAERRHRNAAEQGDAASQRCLGLCYENGQGVEKDFSRAVIWYKRAAKTDPVAQFHLGRCYQHGIGTKLDLTRAIEYYRKSAEAKYVHAQFALATCYADGIGVDKNFSIAIEWYTKAASMYLEYQQELGHRYYREGNKEEAVVWYRRAAEQGFAPAQFSLGYCYETGDGVERDKLEALLWYQRAANSGYAEAQHRLLQPLVSAFCAVKEAIVWHHRLGGRREERKKPRRRREQKSE